MTTYTNGLRALANLLNNDEDIPSRSVVATLREAADKIDDLGIKLSIATDMLASYQVVTEPPTPKCCVCGTKENIHKDGWYGYRCNKIECVCY